MSDKNKTYTLLVVCHLPPPIHGASVMGQLIADSDRLRNEFDCIYIPIRMATRISNLKGLAFSKLVASLRIYFKIISVLLRHRNSALYLTPTIDGFGAIRDCIIVMIARAFGCKRILHLHMRGVSNNFIKSRYYRILYRLIFFDADVIHLSDDLYSDVSCLVEKARFHVVANGAPDPKNIAPNDSGIRSGPRVGANEPIVLFLSNLDEEKGALDLLLACELLLENGIKFKLVFAGAEVGALVGSTIRAAAAKQAKGTIELVGPRYDADKRSLMETADIFAFPSYYRYECQPLSLIEAMAYGLPLVASKIGAVSDLISDEQNGLLFEQRDVEQLSQKLERLILDLPLRLQIGRAARSHFLAHFTAGAFEERFVATISRILN